MKIGSDPGATSRDLPKASNWRDKLLVAPENLDNMKIGSDPGATSRDLPTKLPIGGINFSSRRKI
jgi:hypothetical protein